MKLYVVLGGLLGFTCFATGCLGPGLTHRETTPVGTASLTSAEMGPRPQLDMSDPWGAKPAELDKSDPWAKDEPAAAQPAQAPAQTWGQENPAFLQ